MSIGLSLGLDLKPKSGGIVVPGGGNELSDTEVVANILVDTEITPNELTDTQ